MSSEETTAQEAKDRSEEATQRLPTKDEVEALQIELDQIDTALSNLNS